MFKHGSNKCSRYLARRKEMPRKEQITYCKVNNLKFILSYCFSAACYIESNTEKEWCRKSSIFIFFMEFRLSDKQSISFLWSLSLPPPWLSYYSKKVWKRNLKVEALGFSHFFDKCVEGKITIEKGISVQKRYYLKPRKFYIRSNNKQSRFYLNRALI